MKIYMHFAWIYQIAIKQNIGKKKDKDFVLFSSLCREKRQDPGLVSNRLHGNKPKGYLSEEEIKALSDTEKTKESLKKLLGEYGSEVNTLEKCCNALSEMLNSGYFTLENDKREQEISKQLKGLLESKRAVDTYADECLNVICNVLAAGASISSSKHIKNEVCWVPAKKSNKPYAEISLNDVPDIIAENSVSAKENESINSGESVIPAKTSTEIVSDTVPSAESESSEKENEFSKTSESVTSAQNAAPPILFEALLNDTENNIASAELKPVDVSSPQSVTSKRVFLSWLNRRRLIWILLVIVFLLGFIYHDAYFIPVNYLGVKNVTKEFIGKTVAIFSAHEEKYVSVNTDEADVKTNATADRDAASNWELFIVMEGPSDTIGFLACNGHYLGLFDSDGSQMGARYGNPEELPGAYEQFRIFQKKGYYFIKSVASGNYVRVIASDTDKPIKADSKRINASFPNKWEAFIIEEQTDKNEDGLN